MDSRITFKLGVDYDKVAAARVGFHVEKNAINSLKNINEIYDFDLFFSYINNEFRKRMKKMKNDDVLHPVDVLTDLLIHLVSLTRADDEEFQDNFVEPRMVSRTQDFCYNIATRKFEGGRFGWIPKHDPGQVLENLDSGARQTRRFAMKHLNRTNIDSFLTFPRKQRLRKTFEGEAASKGYNWLEEWSLISNMYLTTTNAMITNMADVSGDSLRFLSPFKTVEEYVTSISDLDMYDNGPNRYFVHRFNSLMFILGQPNRDPYRDEIVPPDPRMALYFPHLFGMKESETFENAVENQPDDEEVFENASNQPSNSQRGGATRERIDYDLFVSIYIHKTIKMMWLLYLLKHRKHITAIDVGVELVLSSLLFMAHHDAFFPFIADQVCTVALLAWYVRLCERNGGELRKDTLMWIVFVPYYAIFM